MPAGSLYVVATPLGNLDDLTTSRRDTLARVDRISAEDTRVTAVLLAHCGIARALRRCTRTTKRRRLQMSWLRSAAAIASRWLPMRARRRSAIRGARLVRAVHDAGHRVVPIPGPRPWLTAVSAAGLRSRAFVFVGFLPSQAKARRELLVDASPAPGGARVLRGAASRSRDRGVLGERSAATACSSSRASSRRSSSRSRAAARGSDAWLEPDANRCAASSCSSSTPRERSRP